jgi:hypothetical protein
VRAENELRNTTAAAAKKIRKRSRNLSNQGVAAVPRRKGEKKKERKKMRRKEGCHLGTYLYVTA